MGDILFNKNDYRILESLIERQCDAPAASLTIKQLNKITDMSVSKIRSTISRFVLISFLQEGSKDGNNKTYYITQDGLEHFKIVFGFDDANIDDLIANFDNTYDKNMEG